MDLLTERLDLLALDKDGKLVIIENKLDDTGREVVFWQAIKIRRLLLDEQGADRRDIPAIS